MERSFRVNTRSGMRMQIKGENGTYVVDLWVKGTKGINNMGPNEANGNQVFNRLEE